MAEVWVRDCSRIQYHAHHAKRWWDAGGEGEGDLASYDDIIDADVCGVRASSVSAGWSCCGEMK